MKIWNSLLLSGMMFNLVTSSKNQWVKKELEVPCGPSIMDYPETSGNLLMKKVLKKVILPLRRLKVAILSFPVLFLIVNGALVDSWVLLPISLINVHKKWPIPLKKVADSSKTWPILWNRLEESANSKSPLLAILAVIKNSETCRKHPRPGRFPEVSWGIWIQNRSHIIIKFIRDLCFRL